MLGSKRDRGSTTNRGQRFNMIVSWDGCPVAASINSVKLLSLCPGLRVETGTPRWLIGGTALSGVSSESNPRVTLPTGQGGLEGL